jgi:hypothetical protein
MRTALQSNCAMLLQTISNLPFQARRRFTFTVICDHASRGNTRNS